MVGALAEQVVHDDTVTLGDAKLGGDRNVVDGGARGVQLGIVHLVIAGNDAVVLLGDQHARLHIQAVEEELEMIPMDHHVVVTRDEDRRSREQFCD